MKNALRNLAVLASCIIFLAQITEASAAEKKIILIAGRTRGPDPDYYPLFRAGCLLLKKNLDKMVSINAVVYTNDWPMNDSFFDRVDAVLLYADGGGSYPAIQTNHFKALEALMKKGVGLGCVLAGGDIPKTTDATNLMDWIGAYCGATSVNRTFWNPRLGGLPDHPITRGVKPFSLSAFLLSNMRSKPGMNGVTPILVTSAEYGSAVESEVGREKVTIMWTFDRPDGGRGFGFAGGHSHKNWGNENFSKLILNALLWIAKADVPPEGVPSSVDRTDLAQNLDAHAAASGGVAAYVPVLKDSDLANFGDLTRKQRDSLVEGSPKGTKDSVAPRSDDSTAKEAAGISEVLKRAGRDVSSINQEAERNSQLQRRIEELERVSVGRAVESPVRDEKQETTSLVRSAVRYARSHEANRMAPEDQATYKAIIALTEKANSVQEAEARQGLLYDFMVRSAEFVLTQPLQTNIWTLRAASALELGYPHSGWVAGRQIQKLGLEGSVDTNLAYVIEILKRNQWWLDWDPSYTFWARCHTDEVKKLATEGHAEAQFILGVCYEDGETTRSIPKDQVLAAEWYRKAAEKNFAKGQANVGRMYANGTGVAKDDVEAVKWFRKAAKQDYASGMGGLGVMYESGRGVAKDDVEAVKWYRRAAEEGEEEWQYRLGRMYWSGRGVAEDNGEAAKWFRKAADHGHASSQANLGEMYANGQGVMQDDAEAVKWFRKAAEQGDARSQANLGMMYAHARGAVKDDVQAVKWFRKAADQGNPSGQFALGAMYWNGQGVIQDEAEAVKWFRKAADQGNEDAKAALTKIQTK